MAASMPIAGAPPATMLPAGPGDPQSGARSENGVEPIAGFQRVNIINTRHERVRLAGLIDRAVFGRDIERKAGESLPKSLANTLAFANRLHSQHREDSSTLNALHAPEVEYLAKGRPARRTDSASRFRSRSPRN